MPQKPALLRGVSWPASLNDKAPLFTAPPATPSQLMSVLPALKLVLPMPFSTTDRFWNLLVGFCAIQPQGGVPEPPGKAAPSAPFAIAVSRLSHGKTWYLPPAE